MKKLLLTVSSALFLSLSAYCQLHKNNNGEIEYDSIITLSDTTSKQILFSKAMEWATDNFKTNSVVQLSDKEAGIITLKGNIPIKQSMNTGEGRVSFTIKIQIKDGKYRYTFNNFNHTALRSDCTGGYLNYDEPLCKGKIIGWKKGWMSIKNTTSMDVNYMINSLLIKMKEKPSTW